MVRVRGLRMGAAMSAEQREAILKRQEKCLWWMREDARMALINEVREDYIFLDVEECVAREMSCV